MDKYSFKEMDSVILKRLVDEKKEEYLSKKRAKELFDKNIFSKFEVGTFKGLQAIHLYLFQDCFKAGLIRNHDIKKGDTLFCKAMYLKDNLKKYLTVTDERNKKKAVERELQQYKLEILQDKYHLDEDVKYVLTDILVKFKAKLQATAVKIDNEITEISEADRLDYLKNTLIDCLEELANSNPPSNRRKAKDV